MVKHIVGWSGGKDSSAMLIRMMEEGRPIDDIVFIEVMATPALGGELPEMYEYIQKMEKYIDRKITVVRSVLDFDTVFHYTYGSGRRTGSIYGFPFTIGAWCNGRLKLRTIRQHYKSYGEHIRYLGLAADEPKRLARLDSFCRAPLAEWGMTEQDCVDFLNKRGMLNPLYQKFRRLGCWFCVKQSLDSLRVLRRDYPESGRCCWRGTRKRPVPLSQTARSWIWSAGFSLEDRQLRLPLLMKSFLERRIRKK